MSEIENRTVHPAIAIVILLAASAPGMAQIAGSAHDFSNRSWNSTNEICVVCHTPHEADTSVSDAPLWNHQVTSATFTVYSAATLDAVIGQPDGASKLCLSCHDGTIAVDSYGGSTDGTHFITGRHNLGTDLSNDHPLSFTYDTALANQDGGLYDPASALSGLGGTIANDLLIANRVQCSSCHDVHNGSGVARLLVKSNVGSELCLTCHNK